MVLKALQVLGFTVGVLSWAGMIGTCASPEWRKNSQAQSIIIGPSHSYDGLWSRCLVYNTGDIQCSNNNAFYIKQKNILFNCRGLMIAALTVGFVAILTTILGMKCVTIGGQNIKAKARVAFSGGLLFGVGGILCGASVSYYAHQMVQEYYNPVLTNQGPMLLRFEYGYALFIGWSSLVLGLLSAAILITISLAILKGNSDQSNGASSSNPNHNYRPVSILQRVPNTGEAISMQARSDRTPFVELSQRQIRMQKALRANKTNGSYNNSAIPLSGRPVYNENQRSGGEHPHHSKHAVRSQSRIERRNAESKRTKTSDRYSSLRNVPPSGLVRSVSGSLKQYI